MRQAPSPIRETLIVSDLHLGLRAARAGELLGVLARVRFERLILLGDLFHDLAFRRLGGEAWTLLRYLRRLAQVPSGVEVVCISGNHDRHLRDAIAWLIGVPARESYAFAAGGKRYEALHGDRFDRFISQNPKVAQLVSSVYGFCERRLSHEGVWPERVDRWHARALSDQIATAALAYGRSAALDVVVCGHTHEPTIRAAQGVAYVNTGAWIGRPGSFVTVGSAGIRLHAHP